MTTVRQPCSMPQSGWTSGIEHVLGPPDGMLGRERAELEFRLGEDLLHQPPEALVELLVAAAGVGEEEAALLDVLAEVLPGRGA